MAQDRILSQVPGHEQLAADRIIALLAQLTRISSDTYRAVEPVVKDHASSKSSINDIDHLLNSSGDNWQRLSAAIDKMTFALTRLIKENKL